MSLPWGGSAPAGSFQARKRLPPLPGKHTPAVKKGGGFHSDETQSLKSQSDELTFFLAARLRSHKEAPSFMVWSFSHTYHTVTRSIGATQHCAVSPEWFLGHSHNLRMLLNLSKHLLIQQAHARTAQTVCKTLCRVVCWQLTITEDAELLDGNDFVKGYCSSSLRLAQSMWGFFLLIEFSTLTGHGIHHHLPVPVSRSA